MSAIRQSPRGGPDGATRNVPAIGEGRFGLAVAEYLSEDARPVTLGSESESVDVMDETRLIQRMPPDASDV